MQYLCGVIKPMLLLVALFCIAPSAMHAQWAAGLTGYVHTVGLSGDVPDEQAFTSSLGFGGGFSLVWSATSDVDVTIGGLLDRRSVTISNVLPLTDSLEKVGELSMSTYAIPVGVRIYAASRRWYFSSGVILRMESKAEVEVVGQDTSASVNGAFQDLEVGVYLGVGYRFNVGNVQVLPELRYEQGLTNLYEGQPTSTLPPAPVIRSSGLSLRISAEYAFGGGE